MKLFEKLIAAYYCAGEEGIAREIISEELSDIADRIYTDKCGNLIAVFGNESENSEKTAVFAPMDKPGLVVTYIEENGTVRVAPLGNTDFRSALYSTVTDGNNLGILYPDSATADKLANTHINFGFKDGVEAKSHLSQGTALFFKSVPAGLENGIYGCAGAGNAACANVLAEAAKGISKKDGKCVYLVFTAQSSLYQRGAYQAAFGVKPSHALSVSYYEGKELAVKILDKSFVCDENLTNKLEEAAKITENSLKRYISEDEMSDAGKIQGAAEGIRTACLLIPVSHCHTNAEAVSADSIASAAKIISGFLSNI